MRKWQADKFGDPTKILKLIDSDPPPLDLKQNPRGFRLKVLAAGVGLPDFFMTQGVYPMVTEPPVSPGQEAVGIVTEAGAECRYRPGDRVMTTTRYREGWGGFGEEMAFDEPVNYTALVPKRLSDAQAAGFLIPYFTGYIGLLQRGLLQAGDTLLVLGGAGSSGSAAIQIGKAAGAHVIAVAGTPEKEEFCRSLGADETVNYRSGPIHKQVFALTEGRGADVIYDPVGGAPGEDALKAAAMDCRFVLIGFAAGDWTACDPGRLVRKNISLVGGFMGNRTQVQIEAATAALDQWTAAGLLDPPVDHVFKFEEVPQLMQRLKRGEMTGKMVLQVSPEAAMG